MSNREERRQNECWVTAWVGHCAESRVSSRTYPGLLGRFCGIFRRKLSGPLPMLHPESLFD
jgi:hypothetical protein